MNQETIAYTLVVTVLGIVVVFLALWLISLMIVALTRIVDGKAQSAEDKPTDKTASERKSRRVPTAASAVPTWVIAAATAYVLEESRDVPRSAEPWAPSARDSVDPWRLPLTE